jgi:Lrp/AsnC family transcriptional regulator for asnA, asnC and gidA
LLPDIVVTDNVKFPLLWQKVVIEVDFFTKFAIIIRAGKAGRMDEIDRAIIACLQYDGRMPFTAIAEQIGVSEGTVRNRVGRLRQEGILQVVGVVDPHLLDLQATAIVGVVVQPSRLEATAREIATFEEVSYLVMISGAFDLLVEVLCEDTDHLASFLSDKLSGVEGVQRTETFYILRTYKLSYRWGMSPQDEAAPPSAGKPHRRYP